MTQRILAIVAIVLIVLGGGYYAYQQLLPAPDEDAQGPVYATAEVSRGDISVGVEATGSLNPSGGGGIQIPGVRDYSGGSSSVAYIIDEVFVEEGDEVTKGQLLVRLVAPELKAQIETKEDELKSLKESLADLLHVPVNELGAIDPSRGITLNAPIDGRVVGLEVTEGKKLDEGEIVARVVDDTRFKLIAKPTSGEFQNIEIGQKVFLSFPQFDGSIEGKVVDVNPNPIPEKLSDLMGSQANGSTEDQHMFVHWVTIEADNPGLVQTGMRARVGFSTGSQADSDNVRWLRFTSPVDSYVKEERVLSRAEAIATRVFVRNMEVVSKGDPIISLAGDDAQRSIQEKLAEVRKLEGDLRRLWGQFDQLEITSTMNGAVAYIEADIGRSVQSGDWIGHIYNTADMRLGINIDDVDVVMVSQGAPVTIKLDAVPGESFDGEVMHVSTMGQDRDGIPRFYVEIKVSGSPQMRPGMQARAFIDAGSAEDVLLIPLEAVFEEDGQAKVEVLEADGSVRVVPVRLGLMSNREAEVQEGLEEGQLVITGSTADLLPSQKIQSQDGLLPEASDDEEENSDE